jgi:hypothetical protein
MRFKSRAQRRKFAELLVKGEIDPETFEAWNRDTGGALLPERVKRPAGKKAAGKKTDRKKTATRKTPRRTSKSAVKSKAKSKRRSKR